MIAAIDLGGTKIEAGVFDAQLTCLQSRRVPTPMESYDAIVKAVAGQIDWLKAACGGDTGPLGVGVPGLVDPATQAAFTSNLPARDRTLQHDIGSLWSGPRTFGNDCKCFALSEATGGAGAAYDVVFGLIVGTGLGGGVVTGKSLHLGLGGLPGEVGHIGIPGALVRQWNLPLLACGCGQSGCYETLCSGPGLSQLAQAFCGQFATPETIGTECRYMAALGIWARLMAELVHTLQLAIDPDCVILGGGLSRIPRVDTLIATELTRHPFPTPRKPRILLPAFGDSSGLRGAAILASRL